MDDKKEVLLQNQMDFYKTQDELLGKIEEILRRMREIAKTAVEEEIDDRKRKKLNQQFEALLNEFRVLELALLEYNYYR